MSNETPEAPTKRVAPATRKGRPLSNGVYMPVEGTIARFVWDTASFISARERRPALKKEVAQACTQQGALLSTCLAAFATWQTFYGCRTAAAKKLNLTSPVVDADAFNEAMSGNAGRAAAEDAAVAHVDTATMPSPDGTQPHHATIAEPLVLPTLDSGDAAAPAAVGSVVVMNQNAW